MESAGPDTPGDVTVEPLHFRKTVALFATGVTVVACDDDSGAIQGMTVNSFTSISLDPATVLISLKASKVHRLITRSGRFGASVLDASQHAHSVHFGGRPQAALAPDFIVRHRSPTLRQCLAWFECEISQQMQVHDHTLFVARVRHCGGGSGAPLVFFGSEYHHSIAARPTRS